MTNLEIISTYYQHFNSQNWDKMLSLVSTGIVHEPNQGKPRLGIENFKQFLEEMNDCYTERLSDITYYTDASGEKFACEFIVTGIYKKTQEGLPPAKNQTYTLRASAFLTVENGKISRIATNYNLNHWIELVS